MKKIISMLMICISVVSIAQTKSISSKIYKQYNIKQKSSITQIDSNLFDVFLKVSICFIVAGSLVLVGS